MLRDKNLIPLSHQHQRALALCVRIDRAAPIADADREAWQAEISQLFQTEIGIHFTAEERVLFPTAGAFEELVSLIEELLDDHHVLRSQSESAQERHMSASDLVEFSRRLSAHIRKEERQLFERMQRLMNAEQLDRLGRQLTEALQDASQACAVPSSATKLRAARSAGTTGDPTSE
jgi:iron-sulfur cluster repair protein YtfE (RIC family)